MIFVTLGTQDKPFERMLLEVEKLCKKKIIKDEVFAQIGSTTFKSNYIKVFDFLPMDEFNKYISTCDLLITHGGVGSIINGLNEGKRIIAIPRLKKYGEHENDHQIEIVRNFSDKGHILSCEDVSDLEKKIENIGDFIPTSYTSNNKNFCVMVKKIIDSK